MPYLNTSDETLTEFLQHVKHVFSETGTTVYLSKEYNFATVDGANIAVKRNSVLEFVRVSARKCRPGDPEYKASSRGRYAPGGPYVWWNFFVRHQNEYPILFTIQENGDVYCAPRSQASRYGYVRRRSLPDLGE